MSDLKQEIVDYLAEHGETLENELIGHFAPYPTRLRQTERALVRLMLDGRLLCRIDIEPRLAKRFYRAIASVTMFP